MQKLATRIFIVASLAFGLFGILLVLTLPGQNQQSSDLNMFFLRCLFACGFIVLSSFALSVAAKYLGDK